MTDQQIIDYYANLLVLQYRGKPKAYATIQTLVTPVIMDQLPTQVLNAFSLNTAVGVQLDVIGKYQGVTRNGYDFAGNPITLDDDDFRSFITMAIALNTSDGTLYSIQNFLHQFFPGEILVFDYQNMRMGYFINSTVGSQTLAEMLVTQGMLPKPMGVQLAITIYGPVIDRFFSFRTYDFPIANGTPFNTYDSYDTNSPWLTYSNGLGV